MYEIFQTEIETSYSRDLHRLLVREWPDFPAFEKKINGIAIPNPVVVLDQNTVIGGASFVSYRTPDALNIGVWLNALFIKPKYRKQGVATSVVEYLGQFKHAVYALTEVPQLYTKCGWECVKREGNDTIVKRPKI